MQSRSYHPTPLFSPLIETMNPILLALQEVIYSTWGPWCTNVPEGGVALRHRTSTVSVRSERDNNEQERPAASAIHVLHGMTCVNTVRTAWTNKRSEAFIYYFFCLTMSTHRPPWTESMIMVTVSSSARLLMGLLIGQTANRACCLLRGLVSPLARQCTSVQQQWILEEAWVVMSAVLWTKAELRDANTPRVADSPLTIRTQEALQTLMLLASLEVIKVKKGATLCVCVCVCVFNVCVFSMCVGVSVI